MRDINYDYKWSELRIVNEILELYNDTNRIFTFLVEILGYRYVLKLNESHILYTLREYKELEKRTLKSGPIDFEVAVVKLLILKDKLEEYEYKINKSSRAESNAN